jgi:membrane protein DedA with SNARE-associated domain
MPRYIFCQQMVRKNIIHAILAVLLALSISGIVEYYLLYGLSEFIFMNLILTLKKQIIPYTIILILFFIAILWKEKRKKAKSKSIPLD